MSTADLTELRVYQMAMGLGEEVWNLVDSWNWFPKQSMGLQLVRSADSIAANISEGYGRYSFKENARFCYFARGSLRETQTWLTKAANRGVIEESMATEVLAKAETLRRSLDNYIRSIGQSTGGGGVIQEETSAYADEELPSLECFLAQFNGPDATRLDSLTFDR